MTSPYLVSRRAAQLTSYLSVIIPIRDRRSHLYLTLTALDCSGFRDFEVVVVDDGSVDHPELACAYFEGVMNVKCVHLDKTPGFGANRARNVGVAESIGEELLFLDSSILLHYDALQHHVNLRQGNDQRTIVSGQYDWLPPMSITPGDVIGNWQAIRECRLPRNASWNRLALKGIVGADPRTFEHPGFFDFRKRGVQPHGFALQLYGANMCINKEVFLALGSFDEAMNRHGGEDCEFALRAEAQGCAVVFASEPLGLHMYHDRDQKQNELDVQANIAYIRERYNLVAMGIIEGEDAELPLIARQGVQDGSSICDPDVQPS